MRIALLRGINVGGHRKVPMADLRDVLSDAGLTEVATYIQSGNVVFDGGPSTVAAAEELIATCIEQRFGFAVPVIVRDAKVLGDLLQRSAELFEVTDPATHDKFVNIGFLAATPSAEAVGALDPERSPGDVIVVEGAHAHLRYAAGQSQTKLTGDHIERTLGVAMTVRNLATVRKLAELTRLG